MTKDQQQWFNQRREEEGLPCLDSELAVNETNSQSILEELHINDSLKSLTISRAPEGLAEKITGRVFPKKTYSPHKEYVNFGYGFVCCFILMVSIWQIGIFDNRAAPYPKIDEVQLKSINHILEGSEFARIRLDLDSDKFVAHALIQLDFPESIQLENHYGSTYIEWEEALFPGTNQLSLPVQYLQNDSNEPIFLSITTDDGVFEFTIEPPTAEITDT